MKLQTKNLLYNDKVKFAIRYLLRASRCRCSCRHIKGHQDDDGNTSLDQWALDNIQMDSAAKAYLNETHSMSDLDSQVVD